MIDRRGIHRWCVRYMDGVYLHNYNHKQLAPKRLQSNKIQEGAFSQCLSRHIDRHTKMR